MKEFRNPQNVHKPIGSYSHQAEIRGNERLLVISGQVGLRMDGTVPQKIRSSKSILPWITSCTTCRKPQYGCEGHRQT